MKLFTIIKNGIVDENPTFRLVLGMCPTMAVTTSAINGVGMGLAATFVLVCSGLVISLLRNLIPDKIRIPAYVIVIAAFVTLVDLFLKAFIPALDAALGIFIPLIVVNCIIFARAESFAGKNPPLESTLDGFGMGIGFTLALTILGSVRELIGNGTLFGANILTGTGYEPMLLAVFAPGGFIALGLLLGAFNAITSRKKASA